MTRPVGDRADPAAVSLRLPSDERRRRRFTRTQDLIWTSQRLHPDVPLANMGKRSRIAGPLDPDRLVGAFDAVVRHAEMLRSVVTDDATGQPGLRVLDEPPRRTEVLDLPAHDLDAWCADRIARPVDATSCVYDSVLLRHGDHDWTWWLDLHHVATDAWSSALVFEATSHAYDALGSVADPIDGPDRDAVADAIAGEIERSFHDAHERAVDAAAGVARDTPAERAEAWRRDVDGVGVATALTPYGPRGRRTTRVDRLRIPMEPATIDELDRALAEDYRTISRELGLLTISAMATAMALHRLDGRTHVVTGVPVHHRSSRHTRRVVGPMMELYPLVVVVDPAESHAAMFARTLRSVTDLLRRATPGESPDVAFEVVLNVLTARYGDFAGMTTTTEWMRSGHVEPGHVVRSQIYDYGSSAASLVWELDVNRALSADASSDRLPLHLAAVVSSIARDPSAGVGDIELVGEVERAELASLEPSPEPIDPGGPVHQRIAANLRADPGAFIAEHRGVRIMAEEFDRRADEVADALLVAGLARGRAVGLRMRRSIDVLVAIHGVLRAGGAFVMLSPDDPPARHEAIARDADLFTILDELPPAVDEHPERPEVDLDDLAYILYTSGSTGQPKGVPIPHRGLSDYLRFAVDAYVRPGDPPTVVALHSSLVFDLTITSFFLGMLVGGGTIVVDGDPVTALGAVAADDRVTFLKATPSQLEIYTRLADGPRPLRTLVVGGEAFRRPIAERIAARCAPGLRIFNEYGPTEAVVGCMVHEWDPALDVGPDVPIGHAAPGSRLVVLDRYGRRTPSGSWGELYVQRSGQADGYLNLPEQTAERFVTLAEPGLDGQWYRTGDRVRVERPGVLTYGGRMDDQLKVGGIRLEPAEVEAALVQIDGIDSALVRVWHPGDNRVGDEERCRRCGLGTDVPGTTLDHDRVCNVCRTYDAVAPQAERWFRSERDLDDELADARRRRRGDIDCLHLLSGGKDSTYALYELVERGWNVHAFTLDNGFISDGAKENIRRSVADLGITHEFATTPAMNEIFRDSLERHSNVCQGCYKTIYTLAVARAHELGIPVVVTGLSRGQFFETRLVPHQFEAGRFDPDEIDRTVLEARRVYHHTPDAVTELLPEQRVFDDDTIFDDVRFVDFYRYVDVDLAELYDFLEHRAPWVRPADTGRSTNCLINVAGISVHTSERGYHNYAEPYSWDVRLGHKTRAEALDELDDDIDDAEVADLLAAVGYRPETNGVLTAWYRADRALDPADLRSQLRTVLPDHAVPSAFVRIDEMPLAASAKADPSLLPAPTRFHRFDADRVDPSTDTELRIARIWAEVLGLDAVGVTDDFFDLGGASLAALETVAAVDRSFGTDLPDAAVFRHRTVRDLATVVDRHLATPHAPDTGAADATGSIPALDADVPRPLSAGEEALLFDYRLDPSSARHSVIRRYVVAGDLDVERFSRAVRTVAMAHTPLHTSYAPDRRVLDPDEAVDVAVLPAMDRDDFDRFADVQRTVPFDLDAGPLVRVHVAPIDGGAHTAVLIALHHISVDAATFDLLWEQVVGVHEHDDVPELPTTAAAHAAWQRSRDATADRDHWLERARSRPATGRLRLPVPDTAEPDGYLSVATSIDADELAVDGTTKFSAAMTATALTLASYTARADVEFGVTFSTKDHPDTADLVGYYLNTVPMALDVGADRGIRDLLHDSADLVADAIGHRTYPFASIVRDARAAELPAPNVSAMLAYEQLAPAVFDGGVVEQRFLPSGVSVTDVTFFVHERPDHVELGLEYRGSVVTRADAERLLRDFHRVVETIASGGFSTVRAVADVLGAGDLVGPQLPAVERPVLSDIVDECARAPESVAVVGGDVALLRRDLVRAVDATAQRLTAAGLGRGSRIGVAVGSRPEVVVAVLAVQSIGAAYVPLDPQVPLERRRRIAEAAGVDAVVVTHDAPSDLPHEPIVAVADPLGLDADVDDAVESLRHRAAGIDPDDPAYVIFTSGSTGVPRGVVVSHRNLAASTAARPPWYGHAPHRFLLSSSIGFDSSVVGLFWPLATGGTVVLPAADELIDVDRLAHLIESHGVTHLLMVPSKYAALLDRAAGRLAGLHVAVVAGEDCPPAVVADHHRLLPGVELVNEYGPTEATVWATAHRLTAETVRAGAVPIGAPIPGTTARIVDERLLPTPPGVAGELLLAGPGVTAGYLGDAAATAEKFVDDSVAATRWYRTGDLVRAVGDVIDFLGRIDDQLNVGGVRVEPGEVEDELRRRPGIRDAVVVAAGSPPQLVAHLHVADPAGIDETALRDDLLRRLPASMVPRRFVAHRDLPRNVHGKVDRAALAALPVGRRTSPVGESPSSGLERVAIDAWRTVLDLADADADTDFFTTGGDSLAAVEIVNRIGDHLGRPVPVAALLTGRTPRGLVDRLDRPAEPAEGAGDRPGPAPSPVRVVRLREGRRGGPRVVMCASWDDVFGYRSLARALPDDAEVIAVAHVEEPGAAPITTVDGFVTQAVPLVRDALGDPARDPTPPTGAGVSVLGWSVGGVVAAEMADRLRADGWPVVSAVLVDTYFPGQQRHLWSNRWWKYRSLLRPGAFGQVPAEARTMLARRVRRIADRLGRRMVRWAGTELPEEPPRIGGFPAEAFDHAIARVVTPIWFYHATTTNPARNVGPWSAVADDITVVDVEGRHRGFDSIMEPPRVRQIADDLARRLAG